MAVKRTDSSTRDKLMDAAQELMLRRGYVAASLGEICTEAGVTKGSFFHYFDCKESLGKALLTRFTEQQHACFADGCCGIDDPLERTFALIDAMIESSRDPNLKGCLVGTFAQEISETHPELREVCDQAFRGFAEGVAGDLHKAKDIHTQEADFDPATLASTLLAIAQGSMLLTKTSGDRGLLEANLKHFRQYLEFLFGR